MLIHHHFKILKIFMLCFYNISFISYPKWGAQVESAYKKLAISLFRGWRASVCPGIYIMDVRISSKGNSSVSQLSLSKTFQCSGHHMKSDFACETFSKDDHML